MTTKSILLSPRLEERKEARESRSRPWRTPPADQNVLTASLVKSKSILQSKRSVTTPARTAPFPFLALPYDIQIMICSFAFGCGKVIRIKSQDKMMPKFARKRPLREKPRLDRATRPFLPSSHTLAQALPFLLPEIAKIWYRRNIFHVVDVDDFKTFASTIGPRNLGRVHHLRVENDFIYCEDPEVIGSTREGSYVLLSEMRSLETLTLYRDDGGPITLLPDEVDDFDSVSWFCELCEVRPSLKRILFSLTPWICGKSYPMARSSMVEWIEGCEGHWNKILLSRRGDVKFKQSWRAVKPAIVGK